jgi:hypothetical protein
MIDKLKHITVNDIDYPVAFTLNVMELIQDKYGSMDAWGNALKPPKGEEPQIKDVIWTFKEFINEGIDIENETSGNSRQPITHKQAGRILSSFGMEEAGSIIRNLTTQSVQTEETKNE